MSDKIDSYMAPSSLRHSRLNIVIDVQDVYSEMNPETQAQFQQSFENQISYMEPEKQHDMRQKLADFNAQSESGQENRDHYRLAIKESVQTLREKGIRTLWMTIGDSSQLYPANEARDPDLLNRLQLTRVAPRDDEDIFLKRYMNAGTDIDDIIQNRAVINPELFTYLNGQRYDQANFHQGIIDGSTSKNEFFDTPTFRQHLKNLGVQEVTLMGQMSEYCVTDNAVSLAMYGIKVKILPGLVSPDRQTTWNDTPDHAGREKAKIEEALGKLITDPLSRGYKISDIGALKEARSRIEFIFLSEYAATLSQDAAADLSSLRRPINEVNNRERPAKPEMARITVREVTSNDWEAYRDFYKTLKKQAPNEPHMYQGALDAGDIDARETYENLFRQTIHSEPKGSFVMFGFWDGNKMVGNGAIDFRPTGESEKKTAGIQGIELLREYQARGLVEQYGLATMSYLKDIEFDGTIMATIRTNNRPSLAAARRNGFVNTGKLDEHGKYILEYRGTPAEAIEKLQHRLLHRNSPSTSAGGNLTQTYDQFLSILSQETGVETKRGPVNTEIVDNKVPFPTRQGDAPSDISPPPDQKLLM